MTYAERIVAEYNRWAEAYNVAVAENRFADETGFAAFMCNAISGAVARSSREDVRVYFREHAMITN